MIRSARMWLKNSGLVEIGTRTRIYLGVRKHKDGRWTHTRPRGDNDRPRACVVLGYRLEFGVNQDGFGLDGDSLRIMVTVRLSTRNPLLKRVEIADVECLEEIWDDAA